MRNNVIKKLLAGIFLFLLWAPMLQQNLKVFKGGELRGAYVVPTDTALTAQTWFNGIYAARETNFLRSSFGFQGDVIRLYNQIQYNVFDIAGTENVVIGKQGYIYEQRYIDSYYGKNFTGDEKLIKRAAAAKELQDTLARHGIFLFTVFAPGKGSFYPEYIPNNKRRKRGKTSIESCVAAYKKAGVNYIDFESYLISIKDTSKYPLYSRGGIHWTYYGEVLVFDSILKYIKGATNYSLPSLKIKSIQVTDQPRFRDCDAGDALNLISLGYHDTLAYPDFAFSDTNKRTLNFMAVGDSYYWMMQLYFTPLVFDNCSFWYYMGNLYSNRAAPVQSADASKQVKDIVLKQNVICIIQTDAGLAEPGLGFFDLANSKFKANR